MGFKKENYTRMGIAMPVLIGISMCLSVLKIQANTLSNPPESCNIGVLQEPRPTSRAKGTRHVQSVKSSYRSADWNGLKNGRTLDDASISTSLESGITSSVLILNNFNFKIPIGSEIESMQIYMDGKAVGDSLIDVRTKDFYLLDASGNQVGDNINNFISLGEDWGDNPDFHQWRYGFSSYSWGGILTPELLNSPNFGLSLDVKNHSDLPVEVLIDRIEIVVQYKPTYTVCTDETHKCIAFLGPRSADITGYTWTLPPGFKELDDSEPEVFNLLIQDDIVPGFYEVCVDVQYSTGSEQCCRMFEMVDCTPSSIGDRVWEDIDGNGVQDDGEPGVDGIQLELYNEIDQVVGNTTSGSDGSYSFSNIDRGCYYIRASNLNGYLPSIGEGNVLDGSNGYGTTDYFTLGSDTSLVDIDLGLVRPAKISGTIWHDANADGTFGDEPTLEGVSVSLDGPDHSRVSTTDGSGNYTFDDLVPGDYKLTVSLLDSYEYTLTGIGAEDVDSDLNEMGMVSIEGIVSGDEVNDIDGGMFKRGTIGNYVWYDFNLNGLQDEGEDGIEGVQVMLMNSDGLVKSSTTAADGSYSLNRVKPDNYFLAFSIDDDYIISLPNAGDDDDVDSDVERIQDVKRTVEFEFISCDSISNLDAGFIFKPGTIEGLVWSDDNRDDQRQPDESRSLSTNVTLYNGADEEIDSKTVDGDRKYFFDQLQPGDFYVKFDAIEDHVFSDANAGSDSSDSDITDADTGTTDLITITPDLTVSNIDAGYEYLVSSIAGTAWEDEDRDNKRGADENNFGGIEVNLYFSNGDLVQSTTTESNGTYKFEELRKNDYYISFAEVEDYLFVIPNEGGESENSNVTQSITTGSTDMISLLADTDITDINAGYIQEVGTIRGEAWEDEDLDGSNNDDVAFGDIEVTLFDGDDNQMRSTTTDTDGTYTFELVPVGDYYVHFELPQRYIYADANVSGDESLDSDVDGTNGEGTTVDVSLNQQDDEEELDGGYVINEGRVEGIVWKDNDEDGQRQDDEPGMEGLEISLIDNSGSEVEQTTTSNGGTFAFEEITAGDYHVKVNIPADNIFTPPNQGDDATDSDISEEEGEGISDSFEVLTGRRTTKSDAGSVDNFGNIYGVAWCDANEDGILESNEELIGDINVDLLNEDGAIIESTTTTADGAYSFLEVPSGAYYLVFVDEDDKEFTEANVGNDDLLNSAVNSSITNGSTFVFRVEAGNKDYFKNAGYQYLPGSISGQAWIDDNSNAANDDSSPFEGITVSLFDDSNNEVSTKTTDANGEYRFDDIRRGPYYVVFGEDSDYLMIPSSESDDSDITSSITAGSTDMLEVVANRETENIDAGYLYARGSVAGNAWIDVDDNGLDDDNAPFQGVTVTLYNDQGEVNSTSTDGDGNYIFSDIFFGEYYVVFADQENYLYANADAGDDTIDSDITGANGDGSTDKFQILPNSVTENIDGGYFLAVGSVSGSAWIDDNDNATNDDGNGFEGIEVTLLSAAGERTVTTTNSGGAYLFEDVLRGTYTVAFDARSDYDFVAPNNGDEDKDSDITGANGEGSTDEITVTPREETKYVDGGYVLGKGSISGVAWIDDNDNAINDGEQGFEGIEVTLLTASGDRNTTSTNAQGEYIFEDVFPGSYTVSFDSRQDYEFVAPNAGDDDIDSDVTGANGDGSTDEITVGARQEVTNIDAGYLLQTGSISGYAWKDANFDDINDEGIAFESIEVTIFSAEGERTSETTNEDGYYIFDDLKPGTYTISFESKEDYDFVNPNTGDEDKDSDITGANGEGSTDEITVDPRQDVTYVDGGYVLGKGSISGVAWIDDNDNAINDGEQGFEGIEVTLLTASGDRNTTSTNAQGEYIFEDVFPGSYTISFDTRQDYEFVTPNAGDDDIDSDVTGANGDGSTDEITVGARQEVTNIDGGYLLQTGSISGLAWMDTNFDDTNDEGIAFEGIEVTLFTAEGERTSGTTNEDGYYIFDDLKPGTYTISFESQEEYDFVNPNTGDEDKDSDVTGANGEGSTDEITVEPKQDVTNIDGGYALQRGSISGVAWIDGNENDINDDDMALEGIEVTLLTATGERTNATTDGEGYYIFEDLIPATYTISFQTKDNYKFSNPNTGDEDQDSDVTGANGDGSTDEIVLNPNEEVKNIDAGYIMLRGGISGSAWKDENGNGIYDGESPFANVTVTLFSEDGTELSSKETNDNGNYMFDDLSGGNYYLVFESKENYKFTTEGQGGEDEDSDVTGANGDGSTDVFQVTPSEVTEDIDAGYEATTGSICGSIWIDDNSRDGINSEEDEFGVEMIVNLENSEGGIIDDAITDPDGGYCFNNIPAGDYRVIFYLLEGQEFVDPKQGDDDTRDSDVTDTENGKTDLINLSGGDNLSYDAGIQTTNVENGSITGKVWKDINRDNVYNEGDELITGLGINLLSDDGEIVGTTASGTDGSYSFDDLDDGQYVVFFENKEEQEFVDANQGDDESTDSDVIATVDTTGSFGVTDIIVINGGQDVRNIDAGIYMEMMIDLGSISGTAWRDENENNIDDDDSGLSGIEVRLFNSAGEELANTTTNDRGNYTFEDIEDGTYYVVFGDRENYEFSEANVGDDDTIDSDVTGSNGSGSTDPFEVIDALDVENIDAGYITDLELFSISGRAFIDENNNNIDDNENGLGDIEVFLLDSLDNELAITNTDDEGSYSFNNLEAGTFVIVFGLPGERDFVSANEGNDDTVDSDIEFVQDDLGATNLIILNEDIEDVDAGYTPIEQVDKGSICGNVWNDINGNNLNDDDSPIEDVEIILRNSDGEEVAVSFSDENGDYTFTDLDEGEYYVLFDDLNDYDYVSPNVGDDDEVDSEVTGDNGDGTTNTFEIEGDIKVDNLDAGYKALVDLYSISGRAFIDSNEDNLDNDENGLSEIQVFLLDSLDNELGVTTTDTEGNYSFDGLEANSYVVVFAQPTDRDFVSANEGDDESIDSDAEFVQDGFGATNIIVLTGDLSDVDAGFTPTDEDEKGSIAGSVWRDEDGNNLNDDDSPYAGIEVKLISLDDSEEVDATTTDASGNYIFTGIDEGDYYITFESKEDQPFAEANAGDDDNIDSEVTGENGEGSTDVIAVADETETNGIDAGYITLVELYAISGRAFIDSNEDNLDDDENGLSDIQVFLLDSLDNELGLTTTDADGNYSFTDLDANSYVVVFAQPTDRDFVSANEGDDDSVDSDVEFVQDGFGATNIIELTGDLSDIDAGFTPIDEDEKGSIAGSVWRDENGNNLNDDDSPYEGIEVKLISLDDTAEVDATTTDGSGNYIFTGIDEGDYYITFQSKEDQPFAEANEGDDDNIDSEVTGENGDGTTDVIAVADETEITGIDAGYSVEEESNSISGSTWIDANGDGVFDDEEAFEGIQVILVDSLDTQTTTTMTDSDGNYTFEDLEAGTYAVVFMLPTTYTFSEANVGDDDSIDSDVEFLQDDLGSTDRIRVGGNIRNVDAGFIPEEMMDRGSISGRAWRDVNENNIDDDETSFAGIEVKLLDENAETLETTSTDVNGDYTFSDLEDGTYIIQFERRDKNEFSSADEGDDDTVDSDVTDGSGLTDQIVISENEDIENIDAGYITELAYYSISGKVWIDADEDNLNNDNMPFEGIQVFLIDTLDAETATLMTDSLGCYTFDNVVEGTYGVVFTLPADYRFSEPNVGDDETLDSDVLFTQNNLGSSDMIIVDQDIESVDAGYIEEENSGLSIAGSTFIDDDENGLNDDDNPYSNVTVVLFDSSGVEITRTSTDDMGAYSFTDIDNGAYYVSFWLDSTYVFTEANVGDDDTIDSDVTNIEDSSGNTDVFDLTESISNLDAGYISTDTMMVATGNLTGVVWEDTDPNGIREDEEPGVQNIEVQLIDSDGEQIQSTTTDGDGMYVFEDIPVGSYTVRFVADDDQTFVLANQGEDDEVDSDVVNEDGSTDTYEVTEDSTVEFVDAGILIELPQASLCGTVWIDSNENGLNDEGEDGVIGIRINIFNENGEFVDSTRSIINGFYSLTDLLGGYYYLEFETDGDYTFTDGDVGDDDGIDSDVTEENGEGTTGVFLGTGKIKLDAGLIPETGSFISGKVWGDTDEDNAFGDGDLLFEGQEVFLVNRLARVIATATTAADGTYRFEIDQSGEYAIFFAMTEDMTFVEANAAGDDDIDSDVVEAIELNGMFGTTDLISFSVGQRIRNVDAGVVSTIEQAESIKGLVWMDENEDGIRQEDESLLAGVEVNIFTGDGDLAASTTTDGDGGYLFNDLESGDYYIQFVASSGEFVEANQGDDDTVDSDVEDLENGNTATFSFESGTVQSFDAGVMGDVEVNTICGTVWNDTDENSINNDEQGRADHTIYLLKDGEAFDTTMTASDGSYSFANLEAGSYQVIIDQLEGYQFAEKNAGDDDSVDSDVNRNGESDEIDVSGKVTIDAGVYFSVVGLSGKVWGDRDEDNEFGDGDILIEGHLVYLINRTARVLETTTTAADGTYRFDGLSSGAYAVFFDVGESDMFVEANASDDEARDSDVTEVIDEIGPYGVTSFVDYEEGSSIGNIDAGLIRTPSTTGFVAGVVWIDNEQDGVRQDDEELFSGIEVKLFTLDGEEVNSAVTDNDGAYEFSGVAPGEYYIEFTLNGRDFVEAKQGGDDRVDSDVEDLSSGRTGNFEVELDATTRIDAGVQPAQTGVCGTVWFDFNENGQREEGEMGQADNEVKLFNSSGDEVAKTNTATNGNYSFPDVEPGDYYIEVFLGGAFAFTEAKSGDEDSDSDITEANGDGTSDTFTYDNGLIKIDAGQISIIPSFISGKVWQDLDGDHILNNDDEVLGDFNVYLQFDGEFIDTAITEPDGTYIFENLAVGNYIVYFEQPDGQFFTLPNIPDEENQDSDVLGTEDIDGASYGFTEELSIGSGQVKVNVDAGITEMEQNPGSISGGIWLDGDEDDKRDEDEGPVEGVVVTLYDAVGSTVGEQNIGEEGTYKFDNLIPGNYAVQFTIPVEYNFVEPNQGDEDENSDVFMFDSPVGITDVITVGDGEDIENIDAGLKTITVNFSTIGDYVWLDFDEDGVLDNDEFGMNDVTVELFDAVSDELVGSMLTKDHPEQREPGFYSFTDLPDGDYYLRFNLPNGYIFSNPRMGNELTKDSDVTGANGTGTTNTIKVEKIKMTDIDVGAISTTKAVIGDFVFNDRNSNGIQDANEDGINNIRVRVFDTDNQQVAQTFTRYNSAMDRAGYFSFKVDPGTYFLRFDISQGLSFTESDKGDNDEKDSDVNGENGFGTTSTFTVDLADTNLSLDAGLITEPANLGDQLWVDENSNGVQDGDEEGLNGIEVSLYDKDSNLMISTTTVSNDGKDGYYLFENISAGSYYISFDLPDEYVSTVANIGGNDAEDSDITNVFGKGTTSLFTLSSGEDELDIDGGIVLGSSIGDYVWEDTDGDGIQDNDESGRAGVFIRLTDESGTVVDTTRTDDNGEYIFTGLVIGDYILEFDLPSDRSATSVNSGSDDDLDSDVDADGKSPIISVAYNEEIDNVDLGLVSNTVAFDSEVDNELIAKVYPNPSIRFVTISTNNIYQTDTDLKEVKIFNGQGAMVRSFNNLKTLKSEGNKSYELDLQGMQPGVYYLRAKVGRLTYKKKLILINN